MKLTLNSVSNSDHFGDVSCFEPYGGGVRFDLTVTSKTHYRLEISVAFIQWFGCQNERSEENYHRYLIFLCLRREKSIFYAF